MEALGHRHLLLLNFASSSSKFDHKYGSWNRRKSESLLRLSSPFKRSNVVVRMGPMIGGEEEEAKQAKEIAAARRRWDSLIREQKVKVLTPREAGYAIQLSNKTLLDVRPSMERSKAWVKGSAWIPIFDAKNDGVESVVKNITNFVMGGWWSGSPVLSYDETFVLKVEEKFTKDSDLIVVCQKGLRSLAACELLYNSGFRNLFWVQGGLEASEEEGDFQREGPQPFKLAGIGGVSEFLGWTDQQRLVAAKEGWSYRFVFTARLVGMFVLADILFFGAKQFGPFLAEFRLH